MTNERSFKLQVLSLKTANSNCVAVYLIESGSFKPVISTTKKYESVLSADFDVALTR